MSSATARHEKRFKCDQREVRVLRIRLGRVIHDIRRKTEDGEQLRGIFAKPLSRVDRARNQRRRKRGRKPYSPHAPEVVCIGKGKARRLYEFGCKVSIATTNHRSPGGQFVVHAKAFHGNPGACPRA